LKSIACMFRIIAYYEELLVLHSYGTDGNTFKHFSHLLDFKSTLLKTKKYVTDLHPDCMLNKLCLRAPRQTSVRVNSAEALLISIPHVTDLVPRTSDITRFGACYLT